MRIKVNGAATDSIVCIEYFKGELIYVIQSGDKIRTEIIEKKMVNMKLKLISFLTIGFEKKIYIIIA